VMQLTPLEHCGAVLGHMGTRPVAFVLRALEVREAARLMEAMPAVGAADLFRQLDVKIGAKLIGSMELEHGAGLLHTLLFATATMATTVTMIGIMPQRVVVGLTQLMTVEASKLLFAKLPLKDAADIMAAMEAEKAALLFEALVIAERKEEKKLCQKLFEEVAEEHMRAGVLILEAMDPTKAASLLKNLITAEREKLLAEMETEAEAAVREKLGAPKVEAEDAPQEAVPENENLSKEVPSEEADEEEVGVES